MNTSLAQRRHSSETSLNKGSRLADDIAAVKRTLLPQLNIQATQLVALNSIQLRDKIFRPQMGIPPQHLHGLMPADRGDLLVG